ncbi:hypothetical protein HYU22_00825 [Candidatus Woesearchaeota archaeon]|nr:hypothetical protein [Candidatus Woesearchaeota archaeon]
MDKKRSLHQLEVRKQHTLAIVSIVILIGLVAVLLYFSPKQFVGKVYEAPVQCADKPAGIVA